MSIIGLLYIVEELSSESEDSFSCDTKCMCLFHEDNPYHIWKRMFEDLHMSIRTILVNKILSFMTSVNHVYIFHF